MEDQQGHVGPQQCGPIPAPTPQTPRTLAEVPATGAMGKETEGRAGRVQDQVPSCASRFRQKHTPETKAGSLPLLFGVSPHVNMRSLPPHPQVPLVPSSLSPHRVPFKITNIKKESGREEGKV